MTAREFIDKWRTLLNYLNRPSVGIHVGWEIIPADSRVETLYGREAWEKIYGSTPPWFKSAKTFKELVEAKDADYNQIVKEETDNGKIEYYLKNGLPEPLFCAFANTDGSFILLGDGNHRFLDCNYLIYEKNINLNNDIDKASVDIIYLSNFADVLRTDVIWGHEKL